MKIECHKLLNFSIFMLFIFLIVLKINLSIGYTYSSPSVPKMFHTVADGPNSIISVDFDKKWGKDFAMANRNSDNILVLLRNDDGTISKGRFYEVGDSPECIISDDFNKDGNPDLAIANSRSDNISILINNGDGTFGGAIDYYVGDSPEAIISGDFYKDASAMADLAVVNSGSDNESNRGSGNLTILINKGDGTFHEAAKVATGNLPKSITSEDFDGDDYIDLAVANYNSNNIFIIQGKGDGTFDVAINYNIGHSPNYIISDDFNKDGNPDLAVANSGSDNISILINNGDGTFGGAIDYYVGDSPEAIISGDFYKDANAMADLAVANSGSDNVSILINNGDGAFQLDANYPVGDNPESIISVDIDKDGYSDLAVVNGGSDSISILINNDGDGTFNVDSNYDYAVGGTPESIITDYFNNDNYSDLAVVNSGSDTLTVLISNGGEDIFGNILFYLDLLGEDPVSVISGDFYKDANAMADLAVANSGSDNVSILINNGDGAFNFGINYPVGDNPDSMVSVDIDKDGYSDLAVVNGGSDNISILINNDGNGTFKVDSNYAAVGNAPKSVISNYFNNDNYSDLAVANKESDNVFIFLGNNDGTFDAAFNYNLGINPEGIISADFNRDNKLDLASANSGPATGNINGNVSVLFGNGDGSFSEQPVIYELVDEVEVEEEENNRKIEPRSITSGDFDNDGYLDLAVASSIINTIYSYDYVTIFFGNGDGTFGRGINTEVGDSPRSIICASFNSGGKADLAVVNSNGITIFPNTFLSKLKPIPSIIVPPQTAGDLGGGICFISSLNIRCLHLL